MKDLAGRERGGDWMLTATGRMFWPLDPRQDEICIEDIARGLAMKCRYGGQVKRGCFYSVAQHSVLVARNVPWQYRRQALLHDGTEAYLGDMIRPLKYQPALAGFCAVEDALEPVIFDAFGIVRTPESDAAVKMVDNRILCDEHQVRMPSPIPWSGLVGLAPLGITIVPWSPTQAEDIFMGEYIAMFGKSQA